MIEWDIPTTPPCPNNKYGLHMWSSSDGWGIIIGVSRCEFCGELAQSKHFELQRVKEKQS